MKRRWLLSLLLFLAAPLKAEIVSFNQFGGLNSDDSPLTLTNGQTPDSENVLDDDGPGLQGRKGFIAFATQTPVTMWEFPKSDGTRYFIANTGTRLLADTGSGTFATLISTVPSDRTVGGSVLGDRFYFVDTLNGLKYWDSSTVSVASATLKCDKLVTWKGRLCATGATASARVIFISKYLDGTTWTAPVNPSDDDAAQITVAGALDENIQALFASFKDILVWFKKNSFGGIYGSRRSNFSQRTFSDFVGVASVETIRDCDGLLRWLGNNRKMWEFDGATFQKISEDIDSIFVTIAQGDSSSKSNSQSSEVDFEAGTQSPSGFADTVTTPGSLTPKTSTYLDTTQADWAAGTCVPTGNCNTTTSAGSLFPYLLSAVVTSQTDWSTGGTYDSVAWVDTETVVGSVQTTYPDGFSTFRNGSGGTKLVWKSSDTAADGLSTGFSFSSTGSQLKISRDATNVGDQGWVWTYNQTKMSSASSGTTYYLTISSWPAKIQGAYFILNPQKDFGSLSQWATTPPYWWFAITSTTAAKAYLSTSQAENGAGATVNTRTSPSGGGFPAEQSIPCQMSFWIGPTTYQVKFNGVLQESGTHTWPLQNSYVAFGQTGSTYTTTQDYFYDDFSVNPQTFTFTTQTYDTGATTPSWGLFAASYSTATTATTPTFVSQVGVDTTTFDAGVSVSSGSVLTSANKRYVKVVMTVSHNVATSTASTPTSIADITTRGFSTFTYTSRTLDTGFTLPVWGLMTTSTNGFSGGGTNSFTTQSSADGISFDAGVSVSTYTKIASATKRYLKYNWVEVPTTSLGYDTNDFTQLYAKSTGTWTSRAITIGTAITAWGPFNATVSNTNGRYTLQMATSTNGTVFAPFQTITNNATPVISTAPFVEARIIFDIDVASETISIDDVTFNWTEGSTIRAASAYSNQRYWLAVAIGSTTNNRILVFDKKRQWQRYNGISADAMTLYNSKLYFGNSTGIYEAENGYNDNGTAIAAYYRTPTTSPNKLDLNSNFDYVYMTTDPSDSTLTSTYQVNGIATNYSLGSFQMNSTTGFQNFKLPFSASEVQTGKNISFKWSVSGTSFWRISNGTLYHQPLALPE